MKLEQLVPLEGEGLGSLEFVVFSCDNCGLVLSITHGELCSPRFVSALEQGKCPDCRVELGDLSLRRDRCTGGNGLAEYRDPRLDPPQFSSSEFVNNRYLTDLPGLGLQEIKINSRLVLNSGRMALRECHYECAKTALDSKAIVLDGGNSFNSSYLEESIRESERETVLHNTVLSRAFNYHQMTSLVTEKLPEALQYYHPKIIGVFEPTLLYEGADVIDEQEAWYSFKLLVWMLRRIASSSTSVRISLAVTNPETKAGRMLQDICPSKPQDIIVKSQEKLPSEPTRRAEEKSVKEISGHLRLHGRTEK